MTNVPLRLLIRSAYQLQENQIVDAPAWTSTEHFDVVGKTGSSASRPGDLAPIRLMMQSLLGERFKLAVHRERREIPAYALVRSQRDGRLGPQLRRSTVDCAAIAAARARGQGPSPGTATGAPLCGIRGSSGHLTSGGLPLGELVAMLSNIVQRVVVDQTGLTGGFDLELTWSSDQTRSEIAQLGARSVASDRDAPDLFTAMQEQLGLKLESAKSSMEVLVIDRVERPSPD
jgi:uncharacterized protein (TIGR03435 family)